ncbi:MAG: protein translocase subunit SecDF [Bacteroidales bacterium]|nr:protein translocase subunit SecDF [Bacteroidales bacterium]
MRNRGVIILFALALTFVTIYQLSFTVRSYFVKQNAVEYAQGDLGKENAYLDSIAGLNKNDWGFLGNTYKEVQEKELNLGLDLKGGMDVILEVSVVDVVKALSNYSKDTTFIRAIQLAGEYQEDSQEDFITLFGNAFQEIDPNARLAAIFGTLSLKEKVDFNSTNQEVLKVLKDETQGAINNSFNILRSRIDRFGVAQPNITMLETQGRIMVELPGVKDPERVRNLLQSTAHLEFWETYENSEVYPYLVEANNILLEIQGDVMPEKEAGKFEDSEIKAESESVAPQDTAVEESLLDMIEADTMAETGGPENIEQFNLENPLFAVLYPHIINGQLVPGSVIGYSHYRDTAKVNEFLNMKQIQSLFPRDIKFFWSVKPYKYDETQTLYELHGIKVTTRDGRAPLSGDVITSARTSQSQYSSAVEVNMSMNAEGAKTWARMTRENIGRCIAIVLDGYVRSAPRVSNEIKGGSSEITGDFTIEEADDLANILKSGKLPAPANIIQEAIIGPSLGSEAIHSGLNSFLIAFIVIMLYMVFYYSHRAGLVADIALIVNMFFLLGVLASLGAVLTLPGIAGIILTIGISVDANVLIFERIREELKAGKGIKLAIADGYKNAYSAIIDANVTTLLTGTVLYLVGTGPIKGFATTLVVGILTSLFSAIFITRLIFLKVLSRNNKLTFTTKITEGAFKNTKIDFLGKRKLFYVISGVFILLGVFSLFTRGLNTGVDFTGGRTYVVRLKQEADIEEIKSNLAISFNEAPGVKIFGNDHQIKITTKFMIEDKNADDEVETKLYEGFMPIIGDDVSIDEFLSDYRVSSQTVGPTIADDIKIQAVWAIFLSLVFIFLYILLRFRNWQYGLGALVALVHDALFILGIFSIFYGMLPFSLEIDQAFIAAILTVVGYSINDTVVVFDRIREYMGVYRKRERTEIMNLALNSTLSRTFSTSLSTFIVLLAVFIFGGEVIRGFAFALLVGVVVGTYSSLFIATPVVFDTIRKAGTIRVLRGKKHK